MDAQVAPFAHRIGLAALERLIAEAIARFMPEKPPRTPRRQRTAGTSPSTTSRSPSAAPARSPASSTSPTPSTWTPPSRRPRTSSSPWDRRTPSTYAVPWPPARSPATSSPSTWRRHQTRSRATTDRRRPKPRQVVLHVHLTDTAITGTSDGLELARVENQRRILTADQIRTWCANPDTQVIVKPVIDLNEHIHVEGYEVPDRLRDQVAPARPHLRVPVVHQVSPEDGCRPCHPLRRGRRHEQRQHRATVPTASSAENPYCLDLHDARTRVVPVVEPARLPVPARPPRHPRRQPRPARSVRSDRSLRSLLDHRWLPAPVASVRAWSRMSARFARCSTTVVPAPVPAASA